MVSFPQYPAALRRSRMWKGFVPEAEMADGLLSLANPEAAHADGTADALPHIFEPFYRTDPSRSQQISGSGLGLAVVRMIAALHDGTVEVTSQAGAGSAFTITFGANHAGN